MSTDTGSRGTVLVIDDEPTVTEVVARYLRRAGYRAATAADGVAAVTAVNELQPDLIVLDLMLPRMGGLEVMRRIRERHRAPGLGPLPVILLTARGEESDRISGLRLGADDYVVKPFSPGELIARIDNILRRVERPRSVEAPLSLGRFSVDPVARRVSVRGEEVQLTVREFDLLWFLMQHPGQVFSRDQLMNAVWQFSFYTDTSTVTVHVRRLRAKIELDPAVPEHLQTVWGVGYRLQP
jgi:two-component system response regulator ResD